MRVRCLHLMLFCLCYFMSSGIGTAIISRDTENKETLSYEFSTQLDSVPIINPTTPDTDNPYPTLNPTSPQPPDTTGPVQTPTSPYTNPTTPNTTPTSPYNNPTTPDTTPTSPYNNPTTPNTTPTSPDTNPTTPDTSPTSPYTNPTTPDTSPTSPYTDPTTPTNPYTTPTTTTPPSPSANPTTPTIPATASAGGQWCVASQSATEKALKVAIDYACGFGGADCSALQPGASCYNPNTIRDHASYAFNDYYQKNPAPTSCAFGGTSTLTNKDPSNGNCHYASSKTTSMSPPSTITPTAPSTMTPTAPSTMTPTAPSTMTPTTPPSMTIPGGASVSNLGPEGSPNIATSDSYSLLLMLTLFGLWASHYVQNYI